MKRRPGRAIQFIRDLFDDLLPILVGLAAWLIAYLAGAGPFVGLIGPIVGGSFAVYRHFATHSARSRAEQQIAMTVRGILDRHLSYARSGPVGLGDFMTLRHLSEVAKEGRIRTAVGFGGPAWTLAQVTLKLTAEFENEIGRDYLRLRASGRRKVDDVGASLRKVTVAATAMRDLGACDRDSRQNASARLPDEFASAVVELVRSGEDLEFSFDAERARVAATERATSAAEKQRREGHGAAVLREAAQRAAGVLEMRTISDLLSRADSKELVRRLQAADAWLRGIDGQSFAEATDEARDAFRRLHDHDIGDALAAAQRLGVDPSDAEARAVLSHRLARFPHDFETLSGVAAGKVRDVDPWPGFVEPGTPMLRN